MFTGEELPPSAAKKTPCPRQGKIAAFGGGESRCSPAGTKGDRTPYGFLSPLDSPHLPLRCDSLRSRSETRGTHRGVWCSKGTPLMEAELFAAERGRPAPSGRALLCAANHASEIQGSSAIYKRKDARNRARNPRLDARPKGVASKGGFGGVKRGQGNHTVPLPPFVLAGEHRLSPAAGRRHSPPPWVRRSPLRRETPAIPRRAAQKGTVSTGCSVVRSLPPGFSQQPRIFREFTQAVCVF